MRNENTSLDPNGPEHQQVKAKRLVVELEPEVRAAYKSACAMLGVSMSEDIKSHILSTISAAERK